MFWYGIFTVACVVFMLSGPALLVSGILLVLQFSPWQGMVWFGIITLSALVVMVVASTLDASC